jgi:hypothetical protein
MNFIHLHVLYIFLGLCKSQGAAGGGRAVCMGPIYGKPEGNNLLQRHWHRWENLLY